MPRTSITHLNEAGMLHKQIGVEKAIEMLNNGSVLTCRENNVASELWLSKKGTEQPYAWKAYIDQGTTFLSEKEVRGLIPRHNWLVDAM